MSKREHAITAEAQGSKYDQIEERMKKRDEYLKRRLHRMRSFVRILDIGFGYSPAINIGIELEFLQLL